MYCRQYSNLGWRTGVSKIYLNTLEVILPVIAFALTFGLHLCLITVMRNELILILWILLTYRQNNLHLLWQRLRQVKEAIRISQSTHAMNRWICKSYSHFFSKNTSELDIVLTRTVIILTTNELVKLAMLWTTGPSLVVSSSSPAISRGQGHSLMMVLDKNRNCHSKLKVFCVYLKRILCINMIFYPDEPIRCIDYVFFFVFFFVLFFLHWSSGKRTVRIEQLQRVNEKCLQKCADSDHPAYAKRIIQAFPLHSYIL